MRFLMLMVLWLILLAVSWPLAILALVALPVLCLLALPFAIVGVAVAAVLTLIKALLFLPARILGFR